MEGNHLIADLDEFLAASEPELIDFRRDLHAHPEPGYAEQRTTRLVAQRLAAAGLRPVILPNGTGLLADVGPEPNQEDPDHCPERSVVALRADLDALPLDDEKDVPYRSTVPGVCHACGHDVHTTLLLGTGLFLAAQARAGLLPGRVRLIFQPAEELGTGARDVIAAGGLASVDRIFALHCDPRLDVGKLGVRSGPITAACDLIKVTLTGPGGHTARPHLTADVVYALGKIVTELPAALSRRVDPRSSLSLVWGRISAGSAANAIPNEGTAEGTVRCLDEQAWHSAADLVAGLVHSVAEAYGVTADLELRAERPADDQRGGERPHVRHGGGRGARPRSGGSDPAEPRRRGLRLVPVGCPGRAGQAGDPHAGGAARPRPAPADLRRRRGSGRRRNPGDGRNGACRPLGRRLPDAAPTLTGTVRT